MIDHAAEAKRFDPDGRYVRRWLPVLARLPAQWLHQPWRAPEGVLADAGARRRAGWGGAGRGGWGLLLRLRAAGSSLPGGAGALHTPARQRAAGRQASPIKAVPLPAPSP